MKKIIILLLALTICFSLCACGGSKIKSLEDIENGISCETTEGLVKMYFSDGILTVEKYTTIDYSASPSGKLQYVDEKLTEEYSLIEDNKIEVNGTTYTYTIDEEDGEVSFNMSFLDITRYFEFTA